MGTLYADESFKLNRTAGTTTNAVDIHVARPRIVQAGNFVLSTINVCYCFYFDAREMFFLEPKEEVVLGLFLLFNP
jgi:hypothetical protein